MISSRTQFSVAHLGLALALAVLVTACGGGGDGGGGGGGVAPPPPNSLLPPATGPGDTLNYFPNAAFDSWTYNAAASGQGQTMRDLSTVSVTGSKLVLGQMSTVHSERLFSDPPSAPAAELYYTKGPGGVAYYGNNDATDTLTAGVIPYAELLFPVTVGPVISFTKTGIDFGSDLDGDGRRETVDATQSTSIAGFESVTVPAGTFPAAARRVTSIVANTRLTSNGQVVTVNGTETAWLAPGAGIVKRVTVADAPGSTVSLTGTLEARGFTVGGVRRGMSNPAAVLSNLGPLTQTNFGEFPQHVDTPAVASSGSTFLVLGKSYSPDPMTGKWMLRRMAALVSPDGPVVTNPLFNVGAPVLSNDTRELHALAFGGGTYLAVFEQRNPIAPNIAGPTEPSILAQRISPAGNLTDATPFELVPQGPAPAVPGEASRFPQVAFGGGSFLVVYCGGPAISSSTFIEGRFVAPDGVRGAPFRISPDFTFNGTVPRLVFDGTNFIVAVGDATGWRLHRVTPAGVVLDPGGVIAPLPATRMHMTTSGAGGALLSWISSEVVYARRFTADLSALDGGPITVASASGGARSAVSSAFIGGEYVLAWSQRLDAMNFQSLVLYTTRIATDGTVQGQTPPAGALPGAGPFAALTSPQPPMPASGYTGGYTLPWFGVGSTAALLAYVDGTSNGLSAPERAATVQGIWVHPFAR